MKKNKFLLPKLPYSYDALEPYIDARTMKIHYTKHHQGYTDKLNLALENVPNLQNKEIEKILINPGKIPEKIRTAVINSGGGYANHNFFWQIMRPHSSSNIRLKKNLKKAIMRTYKSFDKFKQAFSETAAAAFGSGWAWLVFNRKANLEIISTSNQDSPLSLGMKPILALDVWEHAYYLKYQNKRPEYIEAWWNVVNWEKAEELYSSMM